MPTIHKSTTYDELRNYGARPQTVTKMDNGRMVGPYTQFNGYRPARAWADRNIQKRYDQFTAWSPGFNRGWPVERYWEGQLELLPDKKMAIVDPMETIQKIDSPITTADAAAFNAIFGPYAIMQIVQDANYLNALPDETWPSSGFRAVTTASIASGVGVAQSSDRPDTIEPTYAEIPITPKEGAVTTELSDVMVVVSETDDTITFNVNKEVVQSNFLEAWDTDLLVDGDTLACNNMESLDRACASAALSTAKSWTANDEDLYTLDRTSATYFDGQNSYASSTRYLTRDLLDTAMTSAWQYWTRKSGDIDKAFWLTGHDTYVEMMALEEAKHFLTTERATFGMNGVNSPPGGDVGITISKYKGIPVILDTNVVTADDIARIYLVNKEFASIAYGRPLEFLTNGNPFVVGFNQMGLWHYIGEARYTKPKALYEIRDLKN